jgi:hypothetical protein
MHGDKKLKVLQRLDQIASSNLGPKGMIFSRVKETAES